MPLSARSCRAALAALALATALLLLPHAALAQSSEGPALASPPPGEIAREAVRVETVASGLEHPWSLAVLPDGDLLVTERPGRLRRIHDGAVSAPIAGVPAVWVDRQAGLFDVVLDPDFTATRLLYLSYAHGSGGANTLRVARARLAGDALDDLEVIFEAQPYRATSAHYGGRLAFLPDGTLLVSNGEGYAYREEAQRLDSHFGTIVRLFPDGGMPQDNPFFGHEHVQPFVYTYGHRNVQGLAWDPVTGGPIAHEHGPRGGDEINLLTPGANYGWPLATYGIDYSGALISPYQTYPGTVQPVLYWAPSIAPSGLAVYQGDLFAGWDGDLLVGALAGQHLRRVIRDDSGVITGQTALLADLGQRIRDVRVAPDGSVYVLTDAADGAVLRLTPQ
ncbi:MAG: PQQ-dependent sugar dehydrogenase [Rhodospirillaceae bacterium]|nr:PQQ-dependent sugar dehydrogenase [Rhodospirillaceae bacterium]